MAARRRWAIAALGGVALVLLAGRWLAVFAADRWWGQAISPAAGEFLTNRHLLRAALDLLGAALASAWAIGNFLLVYRAVGSVHIARSVANIEFREALTPRTLLGVTVAGGALLGLALGVGTGVAWDTVALAWHGVTYGVTEPLLGRDLGLYVAQLPAWLLAHDFALALVLVVVAAVAILYVLIGAIRWIDQRPAISDHARSHLGWLLAALALCLAWGYLLDPFERVAGLYGAPAMADFHGHRFVAQVLAGAALVAALVSATWAIRPRHTLLVAGWAILVVGAVTGGAVVPLVPASAGDPAVDVATLKRLERIAFGLERLDELTPGAEGRPLPAAGAPSLWQPDALGRVVEADSFRQVAAYPGVIPTAGRPRPVWFAVRTRGDSAATLVAVADDRTTASGTALSYRAADTLAYPGVVSLLDIPPGGLRPGADGYVLGALPSGVAVGAWPRRVPLAWALQVGELLRPVPPATRIDWARSPGARLSRLAPFAEWGPPVAAHVGGELFWVSAGVITNQSFPIVERAAWRGGSVGLARAAVVGVVAASGRQTRVYLRAAGDPLAEAWQAISGGLVLPAAALPRALAHALPYPDALFDLQASVLARPHWDVGPLATQADGDEGGTFRSTIAWSADTLRAERVAVFEHPRRREVAAALLGRARGEGLELELVRLDSLPALPAPASLRTRWSRFASFEQLADSIRETGSRFEEGAVQFRLGRDGLEAYQPFYATRTGGRPQLVWIAVATGNRLGAGRTFTEAWQNLRGATAPLVPAPRGADPLREARGWMRLADSALRAGDWEQFGRAFGALRELLGGTREP